MALHNGWVEKVKEISSDITRTYTINIDLSEKRALPSVVGLFVLAYALTAVVLYVEAV